MDVFIRNVSPLVGDKELEAFFQPVLEALSIHTFGCHKMGVKFANLTFLKLQEARAFLAIYGQGNERRSPLRLAGVQMYFGESTKPPDKFQLRNLEMEAKKKRQKDQGRRQQVDSERITHNFPIMSIACGEWAYKASELVFSFEFLWQSRGELKFGKRNLIVILQNGFRIDFAYASIDALTVGGHDEQLLTVSCLWAPKFSSIDLEALLKQKLALINQQSEKNSRFRKPNLGPEHETVASSCFVYQFRISAAFPKQLHDLRFPHELPNIIHQRTRSLAPIKTFKYVFQEMITALASISSKHNFPVLFQLQKLAQNGLLSPSTVIELLPEVLLMFSRSGTDVTAEAVSKLARNMPSRGPETDAREFSVASLSEWLREYEERAKVEMPRLSLNTTQSSNRAKVFRAKVTPAGVYLYGPTMETKNRVLRKYFAYLDYFIRVEFCDEDGQQVRYDPRISNDKIFYRRFKKILQDGINIVGRVYGFLGYSHSSLRAQTCWFMAPFYHEDDCELKFYQKLLADLGNFSHIHSPAKCAARIGQTFSDTPFTVPLGEITVKQLQDVERNGRVFSDGVGTFSESVLKQIWDALSTKKIAKPTVFQIRHQGAKGVISFDSRIQEHSLFLRPSMIKFEGSQATEIEICGAAWKPLPMYLNRQLIKILEDLGASEAFFVDLQAAAVQRLSDSTRNDLSAAKFLSAQNVGGIVGIPKLMMQLMSLKHSFKGDHFLRSVVKTAAMIELRALKHRTRILVEDGLTLYGIMDETGILNEGEVFVTYDTKLGQQKVLIQMEVIVTRSPALHPGDIRLANAVNVPESCSLRELSNVIVFSQKGKRDLPSQLSGGDLDGDLYNVIFDRDLQIEYVHKPADYPRQEPIDIGRKVEREDMTEFLVTFMATDQLGRIATLHMVKADQSSNGTFDEDCITLAELHSTAVDYSKTGIAIDVKAIPKYSRYRPDFMAPGPHVVVTKKGDVDFTEKEDTRDDEEDFQAYKYYESDKVLGKLYRAINEEEIFRGIEQMSIPPGVSIADYSVIGFNKNVMDSVLAHIKDLCRSHRWNHLMEEARDIREEYEDCIQKIIFDFSDYIRPVSETEVFVGNILGKTGAQTKQQRESSNSMKEVFDEDVSYIMNKIIRVGTQPSTEALERSVACFEISFEVGRVRNKGEELVSFKYVAAAVCLRELERCRGGKLT